jgi:predicted MFS family arabinose efflux permease
MLLAATQDVATDGLAVRILSPEERGPGNGIQVGGYYLGQILGGGVLLLVFGRLGWTPAILAMALVLALPLLPAAALREPRPDEERARRLEFGALGRFFLRPGQAAWVVVLVLYRTGEAMVITMVNPMLVDQGYSLERIGLLLGVAGSLASFGGATLGGLLIQHLGRKPSLVLFGLLESLAITGFLVPASGRGGEAAVYVAAVTLALAGGMGTTALYTIMMDRCARRSGATDFTLQQSLAAMGPILAASLSGVSAAALGYGRHFAVAAVVNLLLVTAAARWLAVPDPEMAASGGD